MFVAIDVAAKSILLPVYSPFLLLREAAAVCVPSRWNFLVQQR
jgi:hypothetical protein